MIDFGNQDFHEEQNRDWAKPPASLDRRGPRSELSGARQSLRGGQAMTALKRVFINALLAASLTTGFAVAQDAPPPPDSQYPATSDSGQQSGQYTTAPGQYTTDSGSYATPNGQYATPDSQTAPGPQANQPEEGGYPATAQNAPPPPQGQQDVQNNSDAQDPSSRVARMQFMDGQVSIQ